MSKILYLKKSLIWILVILTCLASFGITSLAFPKSAQAAGSKGVIFINPGHSPSSKPNGEKGINPDGSVITEDYMNEVSSKLLGEKLRSLGYEVYLTNVMTVSSDLPVIITTPPNPNNDYQGRQYQFRDNGNVKGELVPACNNPSSVNPSVTVEADLIISMHRNGFEDPSANGIEVAYSDNTADGRSAEVAQKSQYIANQLSSQFSASMGGYFRNRGVKLIGQGGVNNALIKYSTAPSVLVEGGFMTNAKDLANMQNPTCQSALMNSIANAVNNYFAKYPAQANLKLLSLDYGQLTQKTYDMAANINVGGSGLSAVRFDVWNTNIGRETTHSYATAMGADGRWHATFDLADFQNKAGTYSIEVYASDANGVVHALGFTLLKIEEIPLNLVAIDYGTTNPTSAAQFDVAATIAEGTQGISTVSFGVWNTDIGRETTHNYTPAMGADGRWYATFDLADFGYQEGTYSIEVYATDRNGVAYALGYNTIKVTGVGPSLVAVDYGTTNPTSASSFDMAATIAEGTQGLSAVSFGVWNTDIGRETTHNYTPAMGADGRWHATFDLADFGYQEGTYSIEVYATDRNGVAYALGYNTIKVTGVGPSLVAVDYGTTNPTSASSFDMAATIAEGTQGLSAVSFGVWNTDIGRETTHNYTPAMGADGRWHATFDLADFGYQGGTYSIEVYATDRNGVAYALGYRTVTVVETDPKMVSIDYGTTNPTSAAQFDVAATIEEGTQGLSAVSFGVWNTNIGRETTHNYTPVMGADGRWHATFDLADFGGQEGTYSIEVYATDRNGVAYALGYRTVKIGITPIMGSSQTSVAQMVNFFNASGKAYPDYYVQRGVNLQQFAQMYYDICQAEGVRAEVAWAQMCLETGYLQFGNDVKIGQFNFAGLGATGGGVPGFDFAAVYGDNANGIRYGIIGHVQHLKCYACTADVVYKDGNGKPIDPRWSNSLRATATTVEALSGKWAGEGYGYSVANLVKRVLTAPRMLANSLMPEEEPQIFTEGENVEPGLDSEVIVPPNDGDEKDVVPEEEPAYSIMQTEDTARVTKEQIINYYIEHATDIAMELQDDSGDVLTVDEKTAFPEFYGMSLEEFVDIYLEEARLEGVNPEVAFAQAMKDTNFLRFGGTIGIDDFVFAADDVSSSVKHVKYANVREGIRAQIQHLKCYASDEACSKEIVDKQWDDALRGKVKDAAMLGNGNWYQKTGYGDELLSAIKEILSMGKEVRYLEVQAESGEEPSQEERDTVEGTDESSGEREPKVVTDTDESIATETVPADISE